MSDTKELKKIKKIYGEKFKNLCRDMFPTIIEKEGTLLNILRKRFSNNCSYLYEAITGNGLEEEFKELIYSEFEQEQKEKVEVEKTPYELLNESGYDLFECTTETDIQSFRKYYAPDEVLCTIYNGGRLKTRDCFFAVRKDVDKIRRENFGTPNKNDEYSTSVLGIQFTRDRVSLVQIISRYNHTVPNPNCTLNNDLDNLVPGLSQSFAKLLKERGLDLTSTSKKGFELPGYVLARDGRYYKYNMEVNGIYYCPGNIIISNGEAKSIDEPERGIFADYFYIDFQNKAIEVVDEDIQDSFVDAFESVEKIEVGKNDKSESKVIKVSLKDSKEPAIIEINEDNQIVRYENSGMIEVGNGFLQYNKELAKLKLSNLECVGDNFLGESKALTELELPNLRRVGNEFLGQNRVLVSLKLPSLEQVGNSFLCLNEMLTEIEFPNLIRVEDEFLFRNEALAGLKLPKVESIGNNFLFHNKMLTELELPELKNTGSNFLFYNEALESVKLPNLVQAGSDFLYSNKAIRELKLPCLECVKHNFLAMNENIEEVDLPRLSEAGGYFLNFNNKLTKLQLPGLTRTGSMFLYKNKCLKELDLPNLECVGEKFLGSNESLRRLNVPKLPEVEDKFKEVISRNLQCEEEELIRNIETKMKLVKEQEKRMQTMLEKKWEEKERDTYQH